MQMGLILRLCPMVSFFTAVSVLSSVSYVDSRTLVPSSSPLLNLILMNEDTTPTEFPLQPLPGKRSDDDCKRKTEQHPVLVQVLEQVCLLCNELYSHAEINVRARCRANCFNNDLIGKCMARFAPRDVIDPDTFQF